MNALKDNGDEDDLGELEDEAEAVKEWGLQDEHLYDMIANSNYGKEIVAVAL